MAFLCPVRIRRGKKKKSSSGQPEAETAPSPGMGRITGSASIETLVRVGIEKEHGLSPDSKMVVLHDFTPCVDDELEVKRGEIVNVVYRENDWVYVIVADSRREGFIPHGYCGPPDLADSTQHEQLSLSSGVSSATAGESAVFSRSPAGRYVVLYTFQARDENDVHVERGEFVTVLNREDPDWYWIVRSDGQEGFIPSGFVYPAVVQGNQAESTQSAAPPVSPPAPVSPNSPSSPPVPPTADNVRDNENRYHGTELVMLYDYKAQAPDDLSVCRGQWVYADLLHQTVEGWLWAHCPSSRSSGFIPTAYARPPHNTQL